MDLARWSGAFPQPLCVLSRKTGFLLQEQIRKHVCVSPVVKDNSLCEVNLILISDFLMVSVSTNAKKALWSQLSSSCSRWRNTPLCFCHGAPLHMLTIFTERMPGSKQSCSCLCVQAADSQGKKKKKKTPSAMLMCSQSQSLARCCYRNSNSVASVTAGLPWADEGRTTLIRFLGVFSYLHETVLMSLYWWEQIRFGNHLAAVLVLKHIEHPQRMIYY